MADPAERARGRAGRPARAGLSPQPGSSREARRPRPWPPGAAAWALLALAVALLGAARGAAHSSSRANTVLTVDDAARVELLLELSESDVLDVFDVDLSSEEEEPRLTPALEGSLPRLLKLSTERGACVLRASGWDRRGIRTVRLRGEAACPEGSRSLTVHWGFGSASSLDLVTYATVRAPGDLVKHAVLSRRTSKEEFPIGRPGVVEVLPEEGAGGAAAALPGLLLALAAALVADPRRRATSAGAAGLGVVAGALVVLASPLKLPGQASLLLASVGGLALVVTLLVPSGRPGRLRAAQESLGFLAGTALALAVLELPADLGAVHPRTFRLARLVGGLAALGVIVPVALLALRRLAGRPLSSSKLAGAASALLATASALALWALRPI